MTILSSKKWIYKNYVNMVCNRTILHKNIVTLTRRRSHVVLFDFL
jgi:hypothetical protein